MRLYRLIRFKLAWFKWLWGCPGYRLGDPILGSGEEREANRRILGERHDAKEPKPEEFGL